MFCARCGSSNDDSAKFCAKCGTSFTGGPTSTSILPSASPHAGTVRGENLPVVYATGKSPVLAAMLSLPPFALGQFYNGDTKKGLLMLVAMAIAIPLWSAGGVGALLDFAVWVWSVVDAYRVASGKIPLW